MTVYITRNRKAFPLHTQPRYFTDTKAYWPMDHRYSKYNAMNDYKDFVSSFQVSRFNCYWIQWIYLLRRKFIIPLFKTMASCEAIRCLEKSSIWMKTLEKKISVSGTRILFSNFLESSTRYSLFILDRNRYIWPWPAVGSIRLSQACVKYLYILSNSSVGIYKQ